RERGVPEARVVLELENLHAFIERLHRLAKLVVAEHAVEVNIRPHAHEIFRPPGEWLWRGGFQPGRADLRRAAPGVREAGRRWGGWNSRDDHYGARGRDVCAAGAPCRTAGAR